METKKQKKSRLNPTNRPENKPQAPTFKVRTPAETNGHVAPDTLPEGPDIIPSLPGEGGGR